MKKVIFALLIILSSAYIASACSSAIISGKATEDGRPLLWKHRDAREEENDLRFFNNDKYKFTGLVNTKDTSGTQVWMGTNETGFSIINTNSYNLDKGKTYKGEMDLEGYFIKEALGKCSDLKDLEKMLDKTKGKRGTQSNFGLIDAKGGAAYYETAPDSYIKYDVNDSKTAPDGYLIRTNFGFSGEKESGAGYIRYKTLETIFAKKKSENALSADFLLLEATRCLKHSLFNHDLYTMPLPENKDAVNYISFRDYVVGGGSVSTMVIHGIRKNENPDLTTIWTIPCFQLTSLTTASWVKAGDLLPTTIITNDGNNSFITENALKLKRKCFPMKYREGKDYLNLGFVLNQKGDGILQKILSKDREIINYTKNFIEEMRRGGFSGNEVQKYNDWLDKTVRDFYEYK